MQRDRIAKAAFENRLPLIADNRPWARARALIAYAPSLSALYRLGWTESEHYVMETRFALGHTELFRGIAGELVQAEVNGRE